MRIRHAAVLGAVLVAGLAVFSATSLGGSGNPGAAWATRGLAGSVRLHGQVPLAVSSGAARPVAEHASKDMLTLSFGFPLRDQAGLNKLIQQEATTRMHLTRAQLYARFSPPQAQVNALRQWLVGNGFRITHVGADRLMLAASASTATVQRVLQVKIADFVRPASTVQGVKVKPHIYYANTTAPTVPARLGLQSISGLSNVDRFFTDVQLYKAQHPGACDDGQTNPQCVDVRSGGYFPGDLRGLYDLTGHGYDATGQTLGFTLWTAAEKQATMTAFATNTGDTPITVDPRCTATGNSPTTPSSCSTVQVSPDHLLTIYENGNSDANTNFGSNVETALDIEAAHGVATHSALKYYADGCASTTEPGSGLANAGCNGSDVGMEEAMEDAANDPTLHSVSNSWGYGGEAEWGTADPFMITTNNILALGAAAGTSFYFSTGDAGTYQSGWPTDSQYVVSIGGTSTYSTSNPAQWSTSTEWSGSGSWCSNIVARPSWQTAPGLASRASCPGRVSPDVSADADPNTGVRFISSTATGTQSGQVGGTSLAAPVMNGLQADTQNFVNAQTYSGPTPQMGFVAPMLYQIGNSGNAGSYYRDIQCGNTANPTSGPDGDAASPGWDPGSGWGEPDWYQFSIGYALQLGATNLSVPPSLSRNFRWSCAQTPSNSSERAFSCPTASTCYAVGAASGATPWYGKFLPSGAWGAANTFFKSADGGKTWFPSNSDMFSIACTGASTCLEVGAGGRERSTSDGGATWSDVATAPGNNKPLTQVQCPSSSICYAAGDRGNVMKSTDGGQTWTWLQSTGANPIYGLSCPTTSVCYAADIYAHILKTTDGGSTWTWQSTPITTPGADQVAETGGPNPFAGLLSISCSDANTCVATGLYVVPSGQVLPSSDAPILTTTDGGATWTRRTSNAGDTPIATTLAAAASIGATNIKVASVSNFAVGQTMVVDPAGANPETVTITTVGTSGSAGTGITFTPALAFAHASGVAVTSVNPSAPSYLHSVSCVPGATNCA
ncbi:MAG TPA: protease pro-enzyme activation domain-containing protein, partial [Acidimicrobiia bacterium]|nr:protease pro-enzyme activation domain-containing protein [Acidimicrobiia bacterium]